MKKFILVLVLIFICVLGFFASKELFAKKTEIIIQDNGFQPKVVTVQKGERIIFKNVGKKSHWPASDFHPTHGIYPEFDPLEGIEPMKEWGFTPKKIGKWRYHDHLFPLLKGEIIVVSD